MGFVTVPTLDPAADALDLYVQPNPAHDILSLTFGQTLAGASLLTLFGTDGRLALQRPLTHIAAGQTIPLEVRDLPAGVYVLRVESSQGSAIRKVVLQ